MKETISKWLIEQGTNETVSPYVTTGILILILILISLIANFITKKYILSVIALYIRKSRTKWDDIIWERKVFERLTQIVPAVIIHVFAPAFPNYQLWIERLAISYMILIGIYVLDSFLGAVDDIYKTYKVSRERPIKGYLQVVQIIGTLVAVIGVIATLLGKSPWLLFSGVGAMTAVILLIFKDSLLGLVASVQMAANNMVRLGDWITMSQYEADGSVIEITLNTVKIQNWDKTITTIPTYAFISESFKNWRGMEESGGRRIKRPIFIDMTSIKFCDEEMLKRFERIQYISEYIHEREAAVLAYNQETAADTSSLVNGRHLTNIGTFRAYAERYLANHPKIHQDMTLMVRQLESTEYGLPVEIYAFANDTAWTHYEGIQSDIFDHLLAILPEFELRVFQMPGAYDFKSMFKNTTR